MNSDCPSCERFIGVNDECPYCGTDSAKPDIYRYLRYGAIILAITGLLFLHLMTRHADMHTIKISRITPLMNYAQVRITGTATQDARIYRKDNTIDYISFTIDDGTGSIKVSARGNVASNIAEHHSPTRGQHYNVTGSLRISGNDTIRMYIQNAKAITKTNNQ